MYPISLLPSLRAFSLPHPQSFFACAVGLGKTIVGKRHGCSYSTEDLAQCKMYGDMQSDCPVLLPLLSALLSFPLPQPCFASIIDNWLLTRGIRHPWSSCTPFYAAPNSSLIYLHFFPVPHLKPFPPVIHHLHFNEPYLVVPSASASASASERVGTVISIPRYAPYQKSMTDDKKKQASSLLPHN